jgi:hypothetical protein
MPSIQEIHIYFMDPNGDFPIIIPINEINNGVTLTTGEQFLIELDPNNDHLIKIINLFNNFQNTKFGSILGIKYVYDDGSVGWIDKIHSSGYQNSTTIQYGENLDVAIGNWVDGKSYNQAIASPEYIGQPYIGYVESWVVFEIKRYNPDPTPTYPPCDLSINSSNSIINTMETTTLTASHSNNTSGVQSYIWNYDSNGFDVVNGQGSNQITIRGKKPGNYTVSLEVTYNDGQKCYAQISITVTYPPCNVSIHANKQEIKENESIILTASHSANKSGVAFYYWNYDHQSWNLVSGQGANQIILTGLKAGTYDIEVTVKYNDEQECKASISVTVNPVPMDVELDKHYLAVTINSQVTLTTMIKSSSPIISYNWVFDHQDGMIVHESNQDKGIFEFKKVGTYIITFSATNQNNQYDEDTCVIVVQTSLMKANEKEAHYKLPHIMKRNARYRGHRESEKYLSSHQEQIFDIRQNWKEINDFTELQESTIKSFFHGESSKPSQNIMISKVKTFTADNNQDSYLLINDVAIRSISNIVVELDGIVVDPSKYHVTNGYLFIDTEKATTHPNPSTLKVTFVAVAEVNPDHITGIYNIKKRLQYIDERLGELERRYREHENAYE